MKIVSTSNFDNETYCEWLVCEHVNEHYGEKIVALLNHTEGQYSPDYFRLKEDDYELYKWRP